MVKVKEDLTGKTFGRWLVLGQTDDYIDAKGKHYPQWLCECNCESHTIKNILGKSLTSKSSPSRSCGCVKKEHVVKMNKEKHKVNRYDLSGEYGIGWTTNTNREFYFDLEDYDKIKDYCWCEYMDKSTGYCSVRAKDHNTNKIIKIHYLLFEKYCDHEDRNPFNNRKYNLRHATSSENSQNRGLQSNNRSGYTGVYLEPRTGNWYVQIKINGKQVHIGTFYSKEDAIAARLKAEMQYFNNEFAPQRHLFNKYDIDGR